MNRAIENKYPRIQIILLMLLLLVQQSMLAQGSNNLKFTELGEMLDQNYAEVFAFSVLIEMDNTEVFYQNFGHSDKKRLSPVNEKTLFNIASITKSVTAVGIMKLVEKDKLKLEDTLGDIFENVPKDKEAIRVRTLLCHKSGFEQNYALEGLANAEEALQTILNGKLSFTPESNFKYSNQNYQLLALIIEEVTNGEYEKFVNNEVLLPLGMSDTYFWDGINKKHDVGDLPKNIIRIMGSRNWGWIGANGIFSTTRDLSKFWNGIYNESFLSQESIERIFNSYYETSSGLQIGYGFFKSPETKWNTSEVWTRGNESWGHNSVIRHFPDKKTTIIVSTNSGEIGKDRMTGNKLVSNMIADYLFK